MWRGVVPTADELRTQVFTQPDRLPVRSTVERVEAYAWPWAHLSWVGVEQAQHMANMMRPRLASFLQEHVTEPSHVAVRSTNYSRTQLTVQAFLNQLLPAFAGPIPVISHDPHVCNLAIFDNKHETNIMEYMMRTSRTSASLRAGEVARIPLHKQLSEVMPLLSSMPISTKGASHAFLWVHASDYFVCSNAHFPDRLPPRLQRLGEHTMEHLLWRFNRLFSSLNALRIAMAPLLGEVQALLQAHGARATPGPPPSHPPTPGVGPAPSSPAPRLQVLAAHDVTLFPFLCFLCHASGLEAPDLWPGYAATISVELQQCAGVQGAGGRAGSWRDGGQGEREARGPHGGWELVWSCRNDFGYPFPSGDVYSHVRIPYSRFEEAVAELHAAVV